MATPNKALLPIIRKVMPSIIANEIIGGQTMMNPNRYPRHCYE